MMMSEVGSVIGMYTVSRVVCIHTRCTTRDALLDVAVMQQQQHQGSKHQGSSTRGRAGVPYAATTTPASTRISPANVTAYAASRSRLNNAFTAWCVTACPC